MGILAGRVALITGAARGQGRSHALRFAQEGANVTVTDLARPVTTVSYEMGSTDELKHTGELIENEGQKALVLPADVRDQTALEHAAQETIRAFGRLDIVVANAGIAPQYGRIWELSEQQWLDVVDINLNGVFHTLKAALPVMIEAGNGGSVIVISSTAGIHAYPYLSHYSAAKHALVGLMRAVAQETAPYSIRVNSVHPGAVDTKMMINDATFKAMRPDLENPSRSDVEEAMKQVNLLPVPWVESEDVTNAVLWLASDAARYITGTILPVDAGTLIK